MSRRTYFQEDETRKTYLGMLTALDDAVGRIVNHLRRCHVAETAKSYQKCDTKCAGWRTKRMEKSGASLTTQLSSSPQPTEPWHLRWEFQIQLDPTWCRAPELEVGQTSPWEAALVISWRGQPGSLPSSQIWTRWQLLKWKEMKSESCSSLGIRNNQEPLPYIWLAANHCPGDGGRSGEENFQFRFYHCWKPSSPSGKVFWWPWWSEPSQCPQKSLNASSNWGNQLPILLDDILIN